jgi:L-seryl-tRNA(Ser) seleniumtransferase
MHDQVKTRSRREIPAVSKVLDTLGDYDLPRPLIVHLIRRELAKIRVDAGNAETPEFASIVDLVRRSLDGLCASRLQPVINGTGIVIHTNFGRAPLASEAIHALEEIGPGYSSLEYDLETGERGRRGSYIENALALLCRAEAVVVVNNCAAALVLIVHHFAASHGRARPPGAPSKNEVIISRGELVQIGGGFRISKIVETTGAKLREIGATNKTTLDDYARAIRRDTAMILKVHRSNFFMDGFVESPTSGAIAALARKKRIPFVEDLGSGAVIATEEFGITDHEPTPAEALKSGVDLVCFSGDKLFGGPQAGIIVGKKRFIAALKREPLFRALRCDKLVLSALQATVDLHLDKAGRIPAIALLQVSEDQLRARAAAIVSRLQALPLQVAIGSGRVKVGGGTLPKSTMSSITIEIVPGNRSLADFAARLRASNPPLVGYIANARFKLDLRTIFPHQDDAVVEVIHAACAGETVSR